MLSLAFVLLFLHNHPGVQADTCYVGLEVETAPEPECASSNSTILLTFDLGVKGEYNATLSDLAPLGEFSTTIYSIDIPKILGPTSLAEITFLMNESDANDWLFLSYDITIVEEEDGDEIPNFNCTLPDPASEKVLKCNCSDGFTGTLCNETAVSFSNAVLQADLLTAVITFSREILSLGVVDCSEFLDSPTILSIGPGANCSTTPTTFTITLTSQSYISIYDDVVLKHEKFGLTSSGRNPLLEPPKPIPPVNIILNGSTTIGQCDGIKTSISGFSNDGGRGINVTWTVQVVPRQNYNFTPILSNGVLEIPESQISKQNAEWLIVAEGESWVGGTGRTERIINQTTDFSPPKVILSETSLDVTFIDPVNIISTVEFQSCGTDFSLSYLWVEESGISIPNAFGKDLSFSAQSLGEGNYTFTLIVNVSVDATIVTSSATTTVRVSRPRLRAFIVGGSTRTVSNVIGEIVFDGSRSEDPLNLPLSYLWTIEPPTCIGIGNSNLRYDKPNLTLPASELVSPSSCIVKLTVSAAGAPDDSASVNMTVVSREVISVGISIESGYTLSNDGDVFIINNNENLQLASITTGTSGPLSFRWNDINQQLNLSDARVLQTLDNLQRNLIIRSDFLVPATDYEIQLSVRSDQSLGMASVKLRVNPPPVGGYCELTPGNGVALETEFTFGCYNWGDPDLPLTFAFFINYNGKKNLIAEQSANVLTVPTLPFSNGTLTGEAQIYDALGAVATFGLSARVRLPVDSYSFDSRIQRSIMQLASAASSLNYPEGVVRVMTQDSMFNHIAPVRSLELRARTFFQLENFLYRTSLGRVTALQNAQMASNLFSNASQILPNITSEGSRFLESLTNSSGIAQDGLPALLESGRANLPLISVDFAIAVVEALSALQKSFENQIAFLVPGVDIAQSRGLPVGGGASQRPYADAVVLGSRSDQIMTTVCRGLLDRSIPGDVVDVSRDGISFKAAKLDGALLDPSIALDLGDGASFSLPSRAGDFSGRVLDVVLRSDASNVYGLYNLTQGENSVGRAAEGSRMYTFDVFDASGGLAAGTGAEIDVGNDAPIGPGAVVRMELPLTVSERPGSLNLDRRFHCDFWDRRRGAFSDEGCAYVETVQGRAVCECTHLTSFVLSADDFSAVTTVSRGGADVLTVAALNITEFPLILYILAAIYFAYAVGACFAYFSDEELFREQLSRAVKFSRRVRRRRRGMKTLKDLPQLPGPAKGGPGGGAGSSDESVSRDWLENRHARASAAGDDDDDERYRPKVRSNTALMNVLAKLRDDCTPFRVAAAPGTKPKPAMEEEYLQRARRLSSGRNPDPGRKYTSMRRAAALGRAFRKRLKQRNGGFDVREHHDHQDWFLSDAVDRHHGRRLLGLHRLADLAREEPLQLQRFWDTVNDQGRLAAVPMESHTPSKSKQAAEESGEGEDDDDDAPRYDRKEGTGLFGNGSAYRYFSDDEKDVEEMDLTLQDATPFFEDRPYSAFSANDRQSQGAAEGPAEPEEPRAFSYISQDESGDSEGAGGAGPSISEFKADRRYSYFTDDESSERRAGDSANLSMNSHILPDDSQAGGFGGDDAALESRRYSMFSNTQNGGIQTIVEAVPAAVELLSGPEEDSDMDDADEPSFVLPDASERRRREDAQPRGRGDGDDGDGGRNGGGGVSRTLSPVACDLLRSEGGRPSPFASAGDVGVHDGDADDDEESRISDFLHARRGESPAAGGVQAGGGYRAGDEGRAPAARARAVAPGDEEDFDDVSIEVEVEAGAGGGAQQQQDQGPSTNTYRPGLEGPDAPGRPWIAISGFGAPAAGRRKARTQSARPRALGPVEVPHRFDPDSKSSLPSETDGSALHETSGDKTYSGPSRTAPAPQDFRKKPTRIATISSSEGAHALSSMSNLKRQKSTSSLTLNANQASSNEAPHNFLSLKRQAPAPGALDTKSLVPLAVNLSSKEPPHAFPTSMKKLDLDGDSEDADTKHRLSCDKILNAKPSPEEGESLSDSSTDVEKESPTSWAYFKEALLHYHVWLSFITRSAFQFSTSERWLVLFCIILGTMAFGSILLSYPFSTAWHIYALFAALFMLPVEFVLSRMFIHSQNRVDIALAVRKRWSTNVRWAATALGLFWMISCGAVILTLGTALEKENINNVWRLLILCAIADAIDIIVGQPLHLSLLVFWKGCC